MEVKQNTLGQRQTFSNTHYPRNYEEVKGLLAAFYDAKQPYSVVSTGNNWGYGCDHSHEDVEHHVNLSRMNRIIHFDEVDGLITIEPGVTYGQLHRFLKNKKSKWITPVHGGGPECSVIGNAIERGYGITPITDHFQAVQSLRALLPNGKLYQSPLYSIGLRKLGKLFRNGIGPYLDGVFTQSNLGVVTEMTIRLAPASEHLELFFIDVKESELEASVEMIKTFKRKFKGTVGGINLMNTERVISMLSEYPREGIQKREPLSEDFIRMKARKHLIAPWTMVGALYGEKSVVKAVKKLVKKDLRKLKGKKVFLGKTKIELIKKIASVLPGGLGSSLEKTAESLEGLFNILNGVPQNTALKLAYWKNLSKAPDAPVLNPNADNCGLIWYAPLVEMNPQSVRDYVKMVKEVSLKFNITPLITLTTIDDLCFDSTIPILFNRDDVIDQKKAHEYFNALLETGKRNGFYPYRLGTNSMQSYLSALDEDYVSIMRSLKDAFDADDLLATGRYIPGKEFAQRLKAASSSSIGAKP